MPTALAGRLPGRDRHQRWRGGARKRHRCRHLRQRGARTRPPRGRCPGQRLARPGPARFIPTAQALTASVARPSQARLGPAATPVLGCAAVVFAVQARVRRVRYGQRRAWLRLRVRLRLRPGPGSRRGRRASGRGRACAGAFRVSQAGCLRMLVLGMRGRRVWAAIWRPCWVLARVPPQTGSSCSTATVPGSRRSTACR